MSRLSLLTVVKFLQYQSIWNVEASWSWRFRRLLLGQIIEQIKFDYVSLLLLIYFAQALLEDAVELLNAAIVVIEISLKFSVNFLSLQLRLCSFGCRLMLFNIFPVNNFLRSHLLIKLLYESLALRLIVCWPHALLTTSTWSCSRKVIANIVE